MRCCLSDPIVLSLTSKDAMLSLGSNCAFTDTLAKSVQKLWTIITSRVKNVARAGTNRVRFDILAFFERFALFLTCKCKNKKLVELQKFY